MSTPPFKPLPDHMFDAFFGKDVRAWETILPLQATPTKPDVVFTNGDPDADFSKIQFDLEKEISQQLQAGLADLPPIGSYASAMAHEYVTNLRLSWYDWNDFSMPRYMCIKHIIDSNERPRRYSGNSHQRRKQRRAHRSHR